MIGDGGRFLDVSHRDRGFSIEQFIHADLVDGQSVAKDHHPWHSQRDHRGSICRNAAFGQTGACKNSIARSNDDRCRFTAGNRESKRRIIRQVGLFVGDHRPVAIQRFDDQIAELLDRDRIAKG